MGQAVTKQDTYTGNVVSFTNNGGAEIDSLSVPISPVQDLHGYSKPWAAGTGKNLLPDISHSPDVNITRNADGTYTVTGSTYSSGRTAVPNFWNDQLTTYTQNDQTKHLPNGTYYLNSGSSSFRLQVLATNSPGISDLHDLFTGYSGTVTIDDTYAYNWVRLNIPPNKDPNTTIAPIVCLNSEPDKSFEPYSNICPITGSTGVDVYVSPTQDLADATTYASDWTSQAGTVYGGTVDIKSGTLTVDRVLVSKTWSDGSNATTYGDCTRKRFSYSDADDKAKKTDAICNVGIYIPNDTSAEWAKGSVFSIHNSSNLFYLSLPTATDGTQAIQLCVYLETPVTYQLTAQTIAALSGANNVWASNNATIKVVVTDILAGFNGWLIKCVTNGTPVEIPLKYIRAETYTVTPDQRMEWSAERDVTGVLHRETVPNTPPKIEFNTPLMTNSDIEALNTIIRNAFTNVLGRDITIQYYNPEQNAYWEWDCYMPDVHYPIRNVDIANNVINYEELRYAFIGY